MEFIKFLVNTFTCPTVLLAETRRWTAFQGLQERRLGAIYVRASAGRQGIASTLLRTVEGEARSLGIKVLRMESSLTAYAFYIKHDFRELERRRHPLADGLTLDCVFMEKQL